MDKRKKNSLVGTSSTWVTEEWGNLAPGFRCYLVAFSAFGIVEASGLLVQVKGFYLIVTRLLGQTQRWTMNGCCGG